MSGCQFPVVLQSIDQHSSSSLVLSTLTPLLETDPSRKCFRLIGGILVERTVTEVEPELRINTEGVSNQVGAAFSQFPGC